MLNVEVEANFKMSENHCIEKQTLCSDAACFQQLLNTRVFKVDMICSLIFLFKHTSIKDRLKVLKCAS